MGYVWISTEEGDDEDDDEDEEAVVVGVVAMGVAGLGGGRVWVGCGGRCCGCCCGCDCCWDAAVSPGGCFVVGTVSCC